MSTVAKKVIMGSGAVAEAYEIEQSLIFQPNAHFSRNVGSASNRKTWTWSAWVKRHALGLSNDQMLFNAGPNGSESDSIYFALRFARTAFGAQTDALVVNGWNTNWRVTNRLFRDVSAWYHIVVVLDTTQSTANNRIKVYINGTQETSFHTTNNPSQDATLGINLNQYHMIGAENLSGSDRYFSGQMAEVNFIDGTALTPSSFGETNSATGQWIPKEYSGSYGTNGFYLKFVSGALGTDSSGEGNNYTAANLENGDVVTDTPTDNFATFNPIFISGDTNTFSEGNLKIVMASTGGGLAVATIVPTAGKYYAEFQMKAGDPSYGYIGVTPVTTNSKAPAYMTAANNSIAYYGYNGQIIAYPNDTVLSSEEYYRVNDIIAVAIDYDNSTIKWYKNNSLQYTKTSAVLTDVTFGIGDTSGGAGQTVEVNFGQKAFAYTPPSGYTTLSTANLPDPAIPLPSAQFNTVLYTGNGGTQSISGVGHQPDWVWIKNRSAADNHKVVDAVRGATKELEPNQANAETTNADGLTAFASDGFALGDDDEYNTNSEAYASWNWKANGAGSTDTSGDIDGVLSANPTAGFSIVTWTGTGTSAPNANATVPHGLGVVPDFVWYKSRVGSSWENWIHSSIISGNKRMLLQSTAAVSSINTNYLLSGEIATSTMISNNAHTTSQTVVAYCFASKPSFSKVGIYTGNGNASGPFVNLDFRPAWILIKRTDASGFHWAILDNKRSPENVMNKLLYANKNDAEYSDDPDIDFCSNGFKLRSTANFLNNASGTYLYMAFAESPFKTANAR